MNTDTLVQIIIAIPCAGVTLMFMAKVILAIRSIVKEVTPNGGTSMKDRVIKLEITARENRDILNDHTDELKQQTKQLNRTESKINQILKSKGIAEETLP